MICSHYQVTNDIFLRLLLITLYVKLKGKMCKKIMDNYSCIYIISNNLVFSWDSLLLITLAPIMSLGLMLIFFLSRITVLHTLRYNHIRIISKEHLLSILRVSITMVIRSTILIIRVRSYSVIVYEYSDVLLEHPLNKNISNICLKTSDQYILISS